MRLRLHKVYRRGEMLGSSRGSYSVRSREWTWWSYIYYRPEILSKNPNEEKSFRYYDGNSRIKNLRKKFQL